jgi:hypothetical protein
MGNTVSCCARREADVASACSGSPKEPRFLSVLGASSSKSSSPEAPSSPVDEVPMALPRQATNRVRAPLHCGQAGSAHWGFLRRLEGLQPRWLGGEVGLDVVKDGRLLDVGFGWHAGSRPVVHVVARGKLVAGPAALGAAGVGLTGRCDSGVVRKPRGGGGATGWLQGACASMQDDAAACTQ